MFKVEIYFPIFWVFTFDSITKSFLRLGIHYIALHLGTAQQRVVGMWGTQMLKRKNREKNDVKRRCMSVSDRVNFMKKINIKKRCMFLFTACIKTCGTASESPRRENHEHLDLVIISSSRACKSPTREMLTKLGNMADTSDDIASILDGLELRLFRLKEGTDRAIHESGLQIDKLTMRVKRQDKFIEYLKVGTSRASSTGPNVPFSAQKNREELSGTSASSSRSSSSAASALSSSSTVTSDDRSSSSDGSTSSDGSYTTSSSSRSSSTSILSTTGTTTVVSLSTIHESSTATEDMSPSESIDSGDKGLMTTEETLKARDEVLTIPNESLPFVSPEKSMLTGSIPLNDECQDLRIWHHDTPSPIVDKNSGFEHSISSAIRSSSEEIIDESFRRVVMSASCGSIKSRNGLIYDRVAASDSHPQRVHSWDSAFSKKEEIRLKTHFQEKKVQNLLKMLHTKMKGWSSVSDNGKKGRSISQNGTSKRR